jgi:YVTN family beta-propeller protein
MSTHGLFGVALAAFALASGAAAPVAGQAAASLPGKEQAAGANRFEKDGVVVDFSARPRMGGRAELMDGDTAEVSFRITDGNGQPIRSLRPAGWMDIGRALETKGERSLDCKGKISLYMKGIVGIRPMLDLNSYYLLVMNKDPSISVIDPLVGMTGRTNLLATVVLQRPGQDWVKSRDDKRVYVSMPRASQVAVVDADAFKVIGNVRTGENPTRVALQPDGRYLWVGNDAEPGKESGVTMIDTETLQPVATIATGRGHHEIAFSSDDRYAFVSNRADGNVSVIDIRAKTKIKDVATGGVPISLDYSRQSGALYVADGKQGVVSVVDGRRHEVTARIELKPGLGPLRFTPDGRYALVVNPQQDAVYVIDPGTNRLKHTVVVSGEPYQITFTRAFAHVRSLASERVSIIPLASLAGEVAPSPNNYAAGAGAPRQAGDLVLAPQIALATGGAAVLVVNPADGGIHYYMEGMNAPSGSFKSYGHAPRAVEVVDRSLRELEPGVYSTKVSIPVAGSYDVAFIMDQPRVIHCFTVTAKENPLVKKLRPAFSVEYLVAERDVAVGASVPLRLRLIDPELHGPRAGLKDVVLTSFVAPGYDKTQALAREVEPGVYEALVKASMAGTMYVYVAVPSLKLRNNDLVFLSLRAKESTHVGKAQ